MRNLLSLNSLFLSLSILLAGHGLQLTLLPLKAQLIGWNSVEIGLTGSVYFLGFILGCKTIPGLVIRVGHIRVHSVMASIATAVLLLIALSESLLIWLLLRFVTGWAFSGLYMVIESWLNDQTRPESRGIVLSSYTLISLLAIGMGQYLIGLGPIEGFELYSIGALLICLSIVPIGLTRVSSPAPISQVDFKPVLLWHRSQVAMVGTFIAGILSGAYWSLGPVYAHGLGVDAADVGLFMGGAVLSGAAVMLPLGKLSDSFDRRKVILGLAIFGIVSCLLAGILVRMDASYLVYMAPLYGASFMPLYSLCLAHANDHTDLTAFVQTAGAILLISSIGSVVGPILIALLMPVFGAGALFDFSAIWFLVLAVWCAYRLRTWTWEDEHQGTFVALTKTSVITAELVPQEDN
jgi:MFS family permease